MIASVVAVTVQDVDTKDCPAEQTPARGRVLSRYFSGRGGCTGAAQALYASCGSFKAFQTAGTYVSGSGHCMHRRL